MGALHSTRRRYVSCNAASFFDSDPAQEVTNHDGQTPYGPHTDVYSLGRMMKSILYYLLANVYTFDDIETLSTMQFGPEYFPYSDELLTAIETCTQMEPEDRIDIYDLVKQCRQHRIRTARQVESARQLAMQNGAESYPGHVLWSKVERNHYRDDNNFRNSFRIHNDWGRNHQVQIRHVYANTQERLQDDPLTEDPAFTALDTADRQSDKKKEYEQDDAIDDGNLETHEAVP